MINLLSMGCRSSATRSARAHDRQETSLFFRLGAVPCSPMPPNKARIAPLLNGRWLLLAVVASATVSGTLVGQRTRAEVGLGVAAATAIRLPEAFDKNELGPRAELALAVPLRRTTLWTRLGGSAQRLTAGPDHIRTLAGTVGLGVDAWHHGTVPFVSVNLVPHWTRYTRRFASPFCDQLIGGQGGFDVTQPRCAAAKSGVWCPGIWRTSLPCSWAR